MGTLRELIYSKWATMPTEHDYMKMYNANLIISNDPRTAWEATEAQWEEMTGKRRYKNFNSFSGAKTRKKKQGESGRYVRTEFDSKFNWLT